MPKYRKKPVEVNAVQWFPGVKVPGVKLAECDRCQTLPHAIINTLEGQMEVYPGSWVVGPGHEGEYWAVQDSIFKATYEAVAD